MESFELILTGRFFETGLVKIYQLYSYVKIISLDALASSLILSCKSKKNPVCALYLICFVKAMLIFVRRKRNKILANLDSFLYLKPCKITIFYKSIFKNFIASLVLRQTTV